jgi:hypothetical protein
MIDPNSRHGRELKAAEEFLALARTATSLFMCAYCQRVAERYLSSQGELKPLKRLDNGSPAEVSFLGSGLGEHVDQPLPRNPEGECHDGAIEQNGSLPERGSQVPRIGKGRATRPPR